MLITREQLKEVTGKDYYDGSALHTKLYSFFRDKTYIIGNIIVFRAPMEVTTGLVDLEDSLAKDYIYSDDAINIIYEIPNVDKFGAVAFQRLYNTLIMSRLQKYISDQIMMNGDDIKVLIDPECRENVGKASVSIAYSVNGVARCHTAININAGPKAPTFAYSTKLTDEQVAEFTDLIIKDFHYNVYDILKATLKV